MWIITTHGFLSIVEDELDPSTVLVRGRDYNDVLTAARLYVRATGEAGARAEEIVQKTPEADYLYRFWASKSDFEPVILDLFRSVKYPNFKNAVKDIDPERAYTYGLVWSDLYEIQQDRRLINIFRDPDTIDLFDEGALE